MLAASADFVLALLTIPLLELSSLLIHVPYRGITNFFRKVLATLGNISVIGEFLIKIAERPSTNNFLSEFRCSRLYGFTSPLGFFSTNQLINLGINILRFLVLPPLQLIKNILILPLIDLLSLTVRISLSIINPMSRIIAYGLGTLLYHGGLFWDNSIGIVFSTAATGLTLFCNCIDNLAGELKQNLLAHIEVTRSELYSWAFHDEDLMLHSILNDMQYYYSDPRRSELIPHPDSHCLLNLLLGEHCVKIIQENPSHHTHHEKLFEQQESSSSEEQQRLSLTPINTTLNTIF